MLPADEPVVAGKPLWCQSVEDDPPAGLRKLVHLGGVLREHLQVGRRCVNYRDAARLCDSRERIGGGIVLEAQRAESLAEHRRTGRHRGDRPEDLLVVGRIADEVQQKLLGRGVLRDLLADAELAEQQYALTGRHFNQGRVAQRVAALD